MNCFFFISDFHKHCRTTVLKRSQTYANYPLSAHYSEAVRCLLEKYPFLGKETIPGARPVEYWRMKLMDKLRNERKHMSVEKKRKSSGVTPAKAEVDAGRGKKGSTK
ncbi:uncharacterized protein [Apostichopus japonicus]|uniref:uncharacterized protein n=1 Tax=Stichopus japonicus TaxID=307972 RepID=UPI003AB22DBA